MSLVEFVLRRLVAIIPVVLGVALCMFLISHAIAGDPATMIAGQRASAETWETIRLIHGLDKPLYEQFSAICWVWPRETWANPSATGGR